MGVVVGYEHSHFIIPCKLEYSHFIIPCKPEEVLPGFLGIRFLRSRNAAPDCRASRRLSITPVSSPSGGREKSELILEQLNYRKVKGKAPVRLYNIPKLKTYICLNIMDAVTFWHHRLLCLLCTIKQNSCQSHCSLNLRTLSFVLLMTQYENKQ